MRLFWQRGYSATSMEDLVNATNVSRHGIYKDYGGKHALFVAGFEIYQRDVVTPAFAQVEAKNAGMPEVAAYFEQQIALAESFGMPGPGCLVANTTTEVVCHDTQVSDCINKHILRLTKGFANVLRNDSLAEREIAQAAMSMTIFTQGLWSTSRVTTNADELRGCR